MICLLLSGKLMHKISALFILILLGFGVVFITQSVFAVSPFCAGMVLVVLTLATPLALICAFDSPKEQ